jgi:phosphoribosylglycinamide formyltransferase 1
MELSKARVAVFISGRGSDMQALVDASKDGRLDAQIVLVVSSNREAYGLIRAAAQRIETFVFMKKSYASPEEADRALLEKLREHKIDFLATAGYLKMLPVLVLQAFPQRIVNIHPALLPKYGGKGMYGRFVHEAVIGTSEKESGVTVHLVDEEYDHGKILEQVKVPVLPDDTPETLAARVLDEEHRLYPIALNKLIKGEYRI